MTIPSDSHYGQHFTKNKSFNTEQEALDDLLNDSDWDGKEVIILKTYYIYVDYFNPIE